MKLLKLFLLIVICNIIQILNASNLQQMTAGVTVTDGTPRVGNFVVGWEFSNTEDVVISALGYYDHGKNGLWAKHTVVIYDQKGRSLVKAVIPAGSKAELIGNFRFIKIKPVTLKPGIYTIASHSKRDRFLYDASVSINKCIKWRCGKFKHGQKMSFPKGTRAKESSYYGPNFLTNISRKQALQISSKQALQISSKQALQISSPLSRAVYQRNSETGLAAVPVEGEILLVNSKLKVEVKAGDKGTWQNINVKKTKFKGTIKLSTGVYSIDLRISENGKIIKTVNIPRVGVGEVFITAGQSNAANYGAPPYTPDSQMVSAWNGNKWRHAYDPQPIASAGGGSVWSRLGDKLAKKFKVPIGFISVAVGSTTSQQWRSALYLRTLKAIKATQPTGFRAILWHQGESDSLAHVTSERYAKNMANLIESSRKATAKDTPWYIAIAAYHPRSSESEEKAIRVGQKMAIKNNANVFTGPNTDNYPKTKETLIDTVHFNANGLNRHASDWLKILTPIFTKQQ